MRSSLMNTRLAALTATLIFAPLLSVAAQQPAPPPPPAAGAVPAAGTPPAPVTRHPPTPSPRAQAANQSRAQGHPQPHSAPASMERGHMEMDHRPSGMMGGPERSILPGGTWWRNADLAAKIGLNADQQKKMDEALLANRVELIHMHATLEEQELLLQPMLKTNPLDEKKVMEQISKVADTRASLEKTNAKMLLEMRAVLTPDQWTKLQSEFHHGPMTQGSAHAAPGAAPGQGGHGFEKLGQ